MPMEESRERFDEALDFIIGAWTSEPFSFEGQYFHARELKLTPRPLQSPYPPVRIAANSPDTFPFAGRRGIPDLCDADDQPAGQAERGAGGLSRQLPSGARGDTALAFPVHVAGKPRQKPARKPSRA